MTARAGGSAVVAALRGRGAAVSAVAALSCAAACAGCGLAVRSADLFLLTRTGAGHTLTLLVNDSGTVACDGRATRSLSDPLLLQARDLASSLDADARAGLRLAQAPGSIYRFTIKLQNGTIAFPDSAAAGHRELAQAELFALQAGQKACNPPIS